MKLKIAFLADIVGKIGRKAVNSYIPKLKNDHSPDLIIANGENAAGGLGLDLKTADEIFKAGINIITSGNHIWSKKDILIYLEKDKNIIRPANFASPAPGKGSIIYTLDNGLKIGVANFIGRVYLSDVVDCPFQSADKIITALQEETDVIFVDFHAEATSEKIAFGYFLDGRATAVVGTHTHVQTADEIILPLGTAFITDAGMCGPSGGVIGANKDLIIQKFLTGRPTKFELSDGPGLINGVIIEFEKKDVQSKFKATKITRIYELVEK